MSEEELARALARALNEQASLTWDGVAVWLYLGLIWVTVVGLLGFVARLLRNLLAEQREVRLLCNWLKSEHLDPDSEFATGKVRELIRGIIELQGETNGLLRSDHRHKVYQRRVFDRLLQAAGVNEDERLRLSAPTDDGFPNG
jgi:hypothetical protein